MANRKKPRTKLPAFHIGPRAARRLVEMRGGSKEEVVVSLTWGIWSVDSQRQALVGISLDDTSAELDYLGSSYIHGEGRTVEQAVADAYRQYQDQKAR